MQNEFLSVIGGDDLSEGNAVVSELISSKGLYNALLLEWADEEGTHEFSQKEFEEKAIVEWDLSQAVFLLSKFYLAGFITF